MFYQVKIDAITTPDVNGTQGPMSDGGTQSLPGLEAWLESDRPRDRARFEHFVPNYLASLLPRQGDVCSIGCGAGLDVELLRAAGFDAYGFDPSRNAGFRNRAPETQAALRVGTVADRPFAERRFAAAYCLEVIEHVGCIDFGTRVTETTAAERLAFVEGCLDLVQPGGFLLLTTSNKLCPIDPGHPHRYTGLGAWLFKATKLGLSVPWHRKNFLWSVNDLKRALDRSRHAGRWTLELLPVTKYPKVSGQPTMRGALARLYLGLVSAVSLLRGSPLNPILVARIRLSA
jgi:hypothetical protein